MRRWTSPTPVTSPFATANHRISESNLGRECSRLCVRGTASNTGVAGRQDPDLTASNKDGAGERTPERALVGYLESLEGRPLAVRSREAYGHQVRCSWRGFGIARR